MALGAEVGVGPGHIVLDGDPVPFPQKGAQYPNFRPMSIVAKQLDGLRCHSVWRKASTQVIRVRGGPSSPQKKKHSPHPIFGPCLLWLLSPISTTAELFSQL